MVESSGLTNFDSIVDVYIAHTERPDSWNNLYERPYMLSKVRSLQNKDLLDLGFGSGFYTKYAIENGANVTAVDASEAVIDRLSSLVKSPRLKLVCADISKPLSFLDSESFDIVICSLVLHYIEDWPPLLSELYRVMRKNGELFISTHHPYLVLYYPPFKGINYFDTALVEDIWGKKEHPFKVQYFTRSLTDILKPIINSKFKIISIEEPLPTEKIQQASPELNQRLSEKPGFLFITLGR